MSSSILVSYTVTVADIRALATAYNVPLSERDAKKLAAAFPVISPKLLHGGKKRSAGIDRSVADDNAIVNSANRIRPSFPIAAQGVALTIPRVGSRMPSCVSD